MLKNVVFAVAAGLGAMTLTQDWVAAQAAPAPHDHAAAPASPAGQAEPPGMDGMHQDEKRQPKDQMNLAPRRPAPLDHGLQQD